MLTKTIDYATASAGGLAKALAAGDLSAVDLTVFPFIALFMRLAGRRKDFVKDDVIGPRIAAWIDRMQTLPIVQRTWPPHLKRGAPC